MEVTMKQGTTMTRFKAFAQALLTPRNQTRFCSFFLLAVTVSACSTVPETGRRQLILLSQAEEMQMGFSSFEQLKKEVPISNDKKLNEQLQRVGKRIAAVAPLKDAKWEFVLFDSPDANAFCLPGGKVGIYTGILPITQDDGGLATVIGHEVAHAVARHGGERVSQSLLLQAGGTALGVALSGYDPKVQSAANQIYGLGSQLGYALPHSRHQESEADHLGILYMADAGYDPEHSIAFWQRFGAHNEKAGSGTPWFLRTHPLDETRIENLKSWLPKAKERYRKSSKRR